MSTPALVIIRGPSLHEGEEEIRLSRRSDGYPTNVLDEMFQAILKIKEILDKAHNPTRKDNILAEMFQGTLVGVGTSEYGLGYKEGDCSYGQWIYIVDCNLKTITLTDENNEVTDPYDYLQCIRKECLEAVRKELEDSLIKIKESGWKINPMSNSEHFIRAS